MTMPGSLSVDELLRVAVERERRRCIETMCGFCSGSEAWGERPVFRHDAGGWWHRILPVAEDGSTSGGIVICGASPIHERVYQEASHG